MLKSYSIPLVLLLVAIVATAGSFQALSKDPPTQTVEKRSSGTTSSRSPRIIITLSQSNITIIRGSPAQIDIYVGLSPSGSFRVSLSTQHVPTGVSVSFSPASSRISFASTMTIVAGNASSVGRFDLALVASGGGITRVEVLSVLEATLVHDLAVIGAASPATATIGTMVTVNATVENYGSVPESYAVNLYANNTVVVAESSTTLLPLVERSTTFSWNTTGFAAGEYALVVGVPPIPGESDIMNNYFQAGNILLAQAPTGNPAPPNPPSGSSQLTLANWRELAISVAVVWILVVALVLFRGPLRKAIRRITH